MMFNSKKHFLAALFIIGSALLLTGCLDETTSSNGNDDPVPTSCNFQEEKLSLSIDEANSTFTITETSVPEEMCVRSQEDRSFSWTNSADLGVIPNSRTADYEFIGDTLVVRWQDLRPAMDCGATATCYGTAPGIMFVGGTAGTLQGNWKMLPTEAGWETRITINNMPETYFNFSDNEFTLKSEEFFDMKNSSDLMNSQFMVDLYNYILNTKDPDRSLFGAWPPSLFYVFVDDETKVKNIIEKEAIAITKKTKTSETFKIGNQAFNISINKANTFVFGNGTTSTSPLSTVPRELSLSISSEGHTCSINQSTVSVTKDLCLKENEEKMSFVIYNGTINGYIFRANQYTEPEIANNFYDCLEDLVRE